MRLFAAEEGRLHPASDAESVGVSRLLAAGVYRFNFAHNLPASLPSSFESHVDHSRRRVAHPHHQHQYQQTQPQQQRKDEQRIKVSVFVYCRNLVKKVKKGKGAYSC